MLFAGFTSVDENDVTGGLKLGLLPSIETILILRHLFQ